MSKIESVKGVISYRAKGLLIEQLNSKQIEALMSFVEWKDVFVSLYQLIGFGKSINIVLYTIATTPP